MSKMTNFLGSFLELQDRVILTQYLGHWEDRGNHKMFRAENGAVMHWWLPKGTIRFNGREDGAEDLEKAMVAAGKRMAQARLENERNKNNASDPSEPLTVDAWIKQIAAK